MRISERQIIRKIERAARLRVSRRLRGGGVFSVGIGDDAAIFKPGPHSEIILTCDWFLEGTHFLRDTHPAKSVGWKCLMRAVSDIAAMGGMPRGFLLSLALPNSHVGKWLDHFLEGLMRASRAANCVLAGGDTTEWREILTNVTVVGEVQRDQPVRRSGARPGDILYVSGRLGEAESGLQLLRAEARQSRARKIIARHQRDARLRKHLYPNPRLNLGRWLAKRRLATAMMDLSDGLSSDLERLCAASGVGAVVEVGKLPQVELSAALRRGGLDARLLALHGGDDYELLFTVARGDAGRIPASLNGVPITAIGEITRGGKIFVQKLEGKIKKLDTAGWDPFRSGKN